MMMRLSILSIIYRIKVAEYLIRQFRCKVIMQQAVWQQHNHANSTKTAKDQRTLLRVSERVTR